ncbi:hypothetical protein M126_4128 [Bacteroides fragilis str. S6L3]|nr:hypothetical protein M074_3966 [Bacteroides fragilis str. DS-166]EYA03055.1 hypothetical protein M126_4128 [Bacteroides fragilis str. S6L3]EYE43779.1 hypothetical protein M127_4018 [Bacteroides fragilis str. S6L5]EYE49751.1 hypothetical protein M131_3988 [Bacteroides fragilis str. S6R8]
MPGTIIRHIFFPVLKEQRAGPDDPTHTATVIIIQKRQ